MAKTYLVEAHGVNDIVAAIHGIKPGQEVAYCTDEGGVPLGIVHKEEMLVVKESILRAESNCRIMRFHRRVTHSLPGWKRMPTGCRWLHIARGVSPWAKQLVEETAFRQSRVQT